MSKPFPFRAKKGEGSGTVTAPPFLLFKNPLGKVAVIGEAVCYL